MKRPLKAQTWNPNESRRRSAGGGSPIGSWIVGEADAAMVVSKKQQAIEMKMLILAELGGLVLWCASQSDKYATTETNIS